MNETKHLTDAELNDIYRSMSKQLSDGKPKWKLELELVEQGIDPDSIRTIMDKLAPIQNSMISQSHQKSAIRTMVIGLVILTIGIAITLISYRSAQGGGTYIVTYGLIIVGIIQLIRGIADYYDSRVK